MNFDGSNLLSDRQSQKKQETKKVKSYLEEYLKNNEPEKKLNNLD